MNKLSKLLSALLAVCMLITCVPISAFAEESTPNTTKELETEIANQLAEELGTDDYTVEVTAYYVSKEYLEDIAFRNRQTNWFGYYLADVDIEMEGKKWVFTTIDGETAVQVFEEYDDTYDIALRNIAIGTGVIVVCVTVSVVTGGLGLPAASAIFAVSAKTAAIYGVSSGAISGVVSGVVTAVQTDGDMDAALKAAAKVGSSSFMWGTVTGAAIGGVSEAVAIHSATASGLSMNEAALLQKQTGWSYETISQIKSAEEAALYQQAGLKEAIIGGRTVLVRDLDLAYKSSLPDGSIVTNLERMQMGYAPLDPETGIAYQLHHVNQNPNGILAILKNSEHQPYASVLNTQGQQGVHSILSNNAWAHQRKDIWMAVAQYVLEV